MSAIIEAETPRLRQAITKLQRSDAALDIYRFREADDPELLGVVRKVREMAKHAGELERMLVDLPGQVDMTGVEDVDRRISEAVRSFPVEARRNVQEIEGDWLHCWRDYRRVAKGAEHIVYVTVSESAREWSVVALCDECHRSWLKVEW